MKNKKGSLLLGMFFLIAIVFILLLIFSDAFRTIAKAYILLTWTNVNNLLKGGLIK